MKKIYQGVYDDGVATRWKQISSFSLPITSIICRCRRLLPTNYVRNAIRFCTFPMQRHRIHTQHFALMLVILFISLILLTTYLIVLDYDTSISFNNKELKKNGQQSDEIDKNCEYE